MTLHVTYHCRKQHCCNIQVGKRCNVCLRNCLTHTIQLKNNEQHSHKNTHTHAHIYTNTRAAIKNVLIKVRTNYETNGPAVFYFIRCIIPPPPTATSSIHTHHQTIKRAHIYLTVKVCCAAGTPAAGCAVCIFLVSKTCCGPVSFFFLETNEIAWRSEWIDLL